MNISNLLKYCLGFTLILFIYACQSDTIYYTYVPISDKGWSKQDTLLFTLPDSLIPGNYSLEVGVRHSGKYAYRDLWLELTQYIPNLSSPKEWKVKKDTVHIYLASEKGNWNGTGTTGGHFQLLIPSGNFTFPDKQYKSNEDNDSQVTMNSSDQSIAGESSKNMVRKKYTIEGKPHTLGKEARYQLKVVHIMTDSVLHHITDIGLRLNGPYHD